MYENLCNFDLECGKVLKISIKICIFCVSWVMNVRRCKSCQMKFCIRKLNLIAFTEKWKKKLVADVWWNSVICFNNFRSRLLNWLKMPDVKHIIILCIYVCHRVSVYAVFIVFVVVDFVFRIAFEWNGRNYKVVVVNAQCTLSQFSIPQVDKLNTYK